MYLRQATAGQGAAIGPFLDDTDFKTAETALTVANTDIKLMVNGGASANKSSGGGTHRVNGFYGVTFDATDTATVGTLDVSIVVAGALPVFASFTVVEEAVYDAIYAANSNAFGVSAFGTLSGAHSTTTADLGTTAPINDISGQTLYFIGHKIARVIDSYNVGTGVATFSPAVAVTLVDGDAYVVIASAPASTGSLPGVDVTNWKGSAAPAMTGDAYARLGAPATATHATDIAAVKSDSFAIKAKTDPMTYSKSQELDVNIQSVNNVTVNGTGASGSEWGP